MEKLISILLIFTSYFVFSQNNIEPIYKMVETDYLNFLTSDSILIKKDKLFIDTNYVFSDALKENPNFLLKGYDNGYLYHKKFKKILYLRLNPLYIQGDSIRVSFNIIKRKNITNHLSINKQLKRYHSSDKIYWIKFDSQNSEWYISSIDTDVFYYIPGPKMKFYLRTTITRKKRIFNSPLSFLFRN